jgi:predicted O-linked N-acetylglucosamine transferase (SPINDLY family)
MLAAYGEIDLALDTFPYNGGLTTCEALWMGVPVVSLRGGVHAARVGASLLSAAGMPELVAESPEQYVRIAAGLAADVQRLAEKRAAMRDALRGSALLDGPAHAGRYFDAVRGMWRAWCAGA